MPAETLTTLLTTAIQHADIDTLRTVLGSMITNSSECRLLATELLLVPGSGSDSASPSDDSDSDTPRGKKRKLDTGTGKSTVMKSRYETCVTCRERFDVTVGDEEGEACRTHDGELEIDTSQFPDDDEIEMGHHIDVETDWRRASHPEGFIWTCCEGDADSEPCVVQAHQVSAR